MELNTAWASARGQLNTALQASASAPSARLREVQVSAPRLQSTSRLTCVALTSVHPTSGLHPLHPGCPPGMGMGPPAFWRGAGASCTRFFPPRRGAPRSQRAPKPPREFGGAQHIDEIVACFSQVLSALTHRAMRSSYPLSFLLFLRASGINSLLTGTRAVSIFCCPRDL